MTVELWRATGRLKAQDVRHSAQLSGLLLRFAFRLGRLDLITHTL